MTAAAVFNIPNLPPHVGRFLFLGPPEGVLAATFYPHPLPLSLFRSFLARERGVGVRAGVVLIPVEDTGQEVIR
jgi:hypothetical protein